MQTKLFLSKFNTDEELQLSVEKNVYIAFDATASLLREAVLEQ